MILFKCRGTTIRTSGVKILILVSLTLVVAIPLLLNGILLARGIADKTPSSYYSHFPRENHTAKSVKGATASVVKTIAENLPTAVRPHNRSVSSETQLLRQLIRLRNDREHIRNLDKFPNPVTDRTLIVVIQVHNRAYYFSQLVRSLAKADGIQDALLVISHDFYSDEINNIVDAIEYCKVVQIFFPYSQQLYPNEFPGSDPDDCARDFTKAKALDMKCNNAGHPDMYGHYREAKFTGTKHHWWWKINHVFDNMNITRDTHGPILFLEEDHFVSPDFYHVLRLLSDARKSYDECSQGCEILSLGAYTFVEDYKAAGPDQVELIPWNSVMHNMGMAIDKEVWLQLKNCEKMFCTYDDYNWDWSLMKLSLSCMKHHLQVLAVKAPHVFHVGECGLHHKGKDCNSEQTIAKFERVISKNMASLFPSSLRITTGPSKSRSLGKPNGGWGDPRDHDLCRQFVKR